MTSPPNKPFYHWTANICNTGRPKQLTSLAWIPVLKVSGQGSRKPSWTSGSTTQWPLVTKTSLWRNDRKKIRAYGERIQHVDQGSFIPLVFTISGRMGSSAKCFYSRLADLMAEKKRQPRSHVVVWMRCRLSFSLLKSALLCLSVTRYFTLPITNISGLDCEAKVIESGIRISNIRVE